MRNTSKILKTDCFKQEGCNRWAVAGNNRVETNQEIILKSVKWQTPFDLN